MDSARFKEELRGRVIDFSVSNYILGLNEKKTDPKKLKQAEEFYKKLENWVMENFPKDVVAEAPAVPEENPIDNEDQLPLNF